MVKETGVSDLKYIDALWWGLPIVGEVGRSGRWESISKDAKMTVEELDQGAWEIQRKIIGVVKKNGVTQFSDKLWQDTLKEVEAGYTIGPFYSGEEVTQEVGADRWIPTLRFGTDQKNKMRGIDSGRPNKVNDATKVTEKMHLSTMDFNMGCLKQVEEKLNTGGPAG